MAFAMVYALLRSRVLPDGEMNLYYTIISIVFSFYFIFLFLHKVIKTYICIITITSIFSLYAFEIYLSFQNSQGDEKQVIDRAKVFADAGVKLDQRNELQVLLDFQAAGEEALPNFTGSTLSRLSNNYRTGLAGEYSGLYPIGGLSGKRVVLCNESGQWLTYVSDKFGFNNSPEAHEFTDRKVALVGDSFTEGYCVPREQNVAGVLSSNDLQVVNFGKGGLGPLGELAALTEYAAPIKPKVLLWMYFEKNDLPHDLTTREKHTPALTRYLVDGYKQGLRSRQPAIDKALQQIMVDYVARAKQRAQSRDISNQLDTNKFFLILRLWHLRVIGLGLHVVTHAEEPDYSLFETVMRTARDRVAAWNGKLYFIYLPAWSRYEEQREDDGDLYSRDTVLSIIGKLDVPIIDFHEIAANLPDPLDIFPLRQNNHYSADGYKLLGQQIYERLLRDRVITPDSKQ